MPPKNSLIAALRSLGDTGPEGFEGLVRQLLEGWTTQRFVLARSGSQHGHDAAGFSQVGNLMLAECRNYSQKTRLDARGLGGQFLEAVTTYPSLDLWVLVTPKEVSAQETGYLKKVADDYGIEVFILDQRESSLGDLEVFCAAYPQITTSFIAEHGKNVSNEDVSGAINAIREDPQFQDAHTRLSHTLSGIDLGFDHTRQRCSEWFLRAVKTPRQSRAVFKQDAAVLDESRVAPLPREHIFKDLDNWWISQTVERPIFTLLGEEGSGKTWAVFQWLARFAPEEGSPIMIPVAANDITSEMRSVQDVVVMALSQRSKRPNAFIARRMAGWLRETGCGRRFLLVLDGLNERPANHWASLLSTVAEAEWEGRIAVITTSWIGFWDKRLQLSVGNMTRVVKTGGYTDGELEQVLATHGSRIADVPADVLPLLRKPRYCDLALIMLPKLGDSNDFTVERLLYEDYKDRHERKTGVPIDHREFCELLCSLAGRFRDGHKAVGSNEIRVAVPQSEEAFQYILGGGLLEDSGTKSRPFKVEGRWLVLGLGMLLAESIRDLEGDTLESCLDAIEQWLEPHPEMVIKADICGAAAYVSLRENYPRVARQALLLRWIGAHNVPPSIVEKLAAYIPEFLGDMISVCDELWKGYVDDRLAQERVAFAFQRALHRIEEQPAFIVAIGRWMSLVNRCGNYFDRRQEDKDGAQLASEIAARAGIELVPGMEFQYAGYTFEAIDDDGLLRLARFALYLLSGTNCYPFANAFLRWALSRKLMGRAHEYEEVAWVLRLSEQSLWPTLKQKLRGMADSQNVVQRQAAHTLLGCIGEKESMQLREEKLSDVYPPHDAILRHQRDPCTSPFSWSRDDCSRCMDRDDVPLAKFVWDVSKHSTDPTLEVTEKAIERFNQYAYVISFDKWHSTFSANRDDINIDHAEAALARYIPETFTSLLKSAIRGIGDRNDEGKRQLLICLGDAAQIIGNEEQQAIEQVLEQYRQTSGQADEAERGSGKSRESLAEELGTLAQVMHMRPDEAVGYLLKRPADSLDLLRLGDWIQPLPQTRTRELLKLLEKEHNDRTLSRLLWILVHNSPFLEPRDERRLIELLDCGGSLVRSLALQLVVSSRNQACLQYVVANKAFRYPKDSWDAQWCAAILAHHGGALSIAELALRLPLGYVGYAVEARGTKEHEVQEYALLVHHLWRDFVHPDSANAVELPTLVAERREQHGAQVTWLRQPSNDNTVRFLASGESWGGGRSGAGTEDLKRLFASEGAQEFAERERRFWETVEELRDQKEYVWWATSFSTKVLSEAVRVCPNLVDQWVAPVIEDTPHGNALLARCNGFYQSLCFALASLSPNIGFKLWERICGCSLSISFTDPKTGTDWFSSLPFSAKDSAEAEEARQRVLKRCFSDSSLLQLACMAAAYGHEEWLRNQVQRLVRSDSLADRAKGIALSCLSVVDDAVIDSLIEEGDINGTWVEHLVPKIRAYFDRKEWARYWYRRFLEADCQEESWCAFRLFLKCVDRRWRIWVEDLEQEFLSRADASEWRVRFRRTLGDRIRQAVDANEKALKDVYLTIKFEQGQLIPFS